MDSKLLTEEKRKEAIRNITQILQDQLDEKIGIIKAEIFLDEILETIGKEIYNKGIEDSKEKLQMILEETTFHIEELKL